MFARRMVLVGLVVCFVFTGLSWRAISMQTGDSSTEARKRAESFLVETLVVPTSRGKIYDRNGMVLAQDDIGNQVSISYRLLSGTWASDYATYAAKQDSRWHDTTLEIRQGLIAEYQTLFSQQQAAYLQDISDICDVPLDLLVQRRDFTHRRIRNMLDHLVYTRLKRREANRGEPLSQKEKDEEYRNFSLLEQRQYHWIARDVDTAAYRSLREKIDTATTLAEDEGDFSQAVWQEVKLQRPQVRRYPLVRWPNQWFEKPIVIDCRTLPDNLRDDRDIEVPLNGVGMHVIGFMRDARSEDIVARPFPSLRRDSFDGIDLGGYRSHDRVGAAGIERALEDQLRGTVGLRQVERDGTVLYERAPVEGQDVHLSLDIVLQARIEALVADWKKEDGYPRAERVLSGERDSPIPENTTGLFHYQPYHALPAANSEIVARQGFTSSGKFNGSVVVIEIASGEVLAAASRPALSMDVLKDNPELLRLNNIDRPLEFRLTERTYQPASTVKPFVLASAISQGVYDVENGIGDTYELRGYLWPNPKNNPPGSFRCWYYRMRYGEETFGVREDAGAYALAVSTNPFFGELVQAETGMGHPVFISWMHRFGMGQPLASELDGGKIRGYLGPREGNVLERDACYMAIGQGMLEMTPMHLARAYLRLLNANTAMEPTFLRRPNGWQQPTPVVLPGQRPLTQEAVDYVLKGMGMALTADHGSLTGGYATNYDTGYREHQKIFNVAGVRVWGKSGTAQTYPEIIDSDGDDRITSNDTIVRSGNHGWTVALCAPEGESEPRYMVVAMVAYGGSGGRSAGPVANQAIHALKKQGYLQPRDVLIQVAL